MGIVHAEQCISRIPFLDPHCANSKPQLNVDIEAKVHTKEETRLILTLKENNFQLEVMTWTR